MTKGPPARRTEKKSTLSSIQIIKIKLIEKQKGQTKRKEIEIKEQEKPLRPVLTAFCDVLNWLVYESSSDKFLSSHFNPPHFIQC